MRLFHMAQGTPEWLAVRLGRPTASQFHRIITPVKGDLSKSASGYAYELVAETLLGRPLEGSQFATFATDRGKQLEPLAVQQYEFTNDVETQLVGFVTTDDGRIGCSPDRLVGAHGGMEIKCTMDATHMGLLIDGPGADYRPQVQGQLAIGELEWMDLYCYHPQLPPVCIRTLRDEDYIAKMGAALSQFLELRDAMLEKARATGFFEAAREECPDNGPTDPWEASGTGLLGRIADFITPTINA